MALKQDCILRMIEELINVLIKTLDTKRKDDNIDEDLFENNEFLKRLKMLVDDNKINEAENELFDKLDISSYKDFFIGMEFYKYLNSKEDEFLNSSDYTREEIIEGLSDLSKKYGFGDFVGMFMES